MRPFPQSFNKAIGPLMLQGGLEIEPPPVGTSDSQPFAGAGIGNPYFFSTVFNTRCAGQSGNLRSTWIPIYAYRPLAIKKVFINARFGSGYSSPDTTLSARLGHRIMQYAGSWDTQPSVILGDTGIQTVTRGSTSVAATWHTHDFTTTINLLKGQRAWLLPYNDVDPSQSIDNYRVEGVGNTLPDWLIDTEWNNLRWRANNGTSVWQPRTSTQASFGCQNILLDADDNPIHGWSGYTGSAHVINFGASGSYCEQVFVHPFDCTINKMWTRFWRENSQTGTLRMQIIRDSDSVVLNTTDIDISTILNSGYSDANALETALSGSVDLEADIVYRARFTSLNTAARLATHLNLPDGPSADFWIKDVGDETRCRARENTGGDLDFGGNYRKDGSPFWQNMQLFFERTA